MSHPEEASRGPDKPAAPQFATTHWSVVLAAGRESSPHSDEALATLCETYWFPLYAYARRRVADAHQARDLTQAFFTELLEKEYVASAQRERGRFRAFLITSFKHFLSKEWDKAKAQKRGGGKPPISLNFEEGETRYAIEPCSELTAERLFAREWTLTLLSQIMRRLESEWTESGKGRQFQLLKRFLIGDHVGVTYIDIASQLDMTEAAVKMSAHRMRNRYRELLTDEIAQTVADPNEVDDEIRLLFESLKK